LVLPKKNQFRERSDCPWGGTERKLRLLKKKGVHWGEKLTRPGEVAVEGEKGSKVSSDWGSVLGEAQKSQGVFTKGFMKQGEGKVSGGWGTCGCILKVPVWS